MRPETGQRTLTKGPRTQRILRYCLYPETGQRTLTKGPRTQRILKHCVRPETGQRTLTKESRTRGAKDTNKGTKDTEDLVTLRASGNGTKVQY